MRPLRGPDKTRGRARLRRRRGRTNRGCLRRQRAGRDSAIRSRPTPRRWWSARTAMSYTKISRDSDRVMSSVWAVRPPTTSITVRRREHPEVLAREEPGDVLVAQGFVLFFEHTRPSSRRASWPSACRRGAPESRDPVARGLHRHRTPCVSRYPARPARVSTESTTAPRCTVRPHEIHGRRRESRPPSTQRHWTPKDVKRQPTLFAQGASTRRRPACRGLVAFASRASAASVKLSSADCRAGSTQGRRSPACRGQRAPVLEALAR